MLLHDGKFFLPRLYLHCLRSSYAIIHLLYTHLSKIISAIFLWQVTQDVTLNFSWTY